MKKQAARMRPLRAWVIQLPDGELAYGARLFFWRYEAHQQARMLHARVVRVEVREVPRKVVRTPAESRRGRSGKRRPTSKKGR